MAQVVTTELLCDFHLEREERVEAQTIPPVSIDRARSLELDLCKECREDYLEPILELLRKHGRKPARRNGAATKAKQRPEPRRIELDSHVCDDCSRTFNTAQGLKAHRTRVHGNGRPAAVEEEPTVAGESAVEYPCPDCPKTFNRAASLGTHRARAHGYRRAGK